MEIKILGEHVTITDAISKYIKEKFSHLPSPEKLQHVEFRLGVKKESQYVHFLARCAKEEIFIKTQNTNLYTAIDESMQKIHRSFTKVKEKHNMHLYKSTI